MGCLGTYMIVWELEGGGWMGQESSYSVPTPRVCFEASSGHIWAFLPQTVSAQKGTFE